MTAPPPGPAPARVLADRFELRHVLGTGGMATVWSAYDRRLGRTVAVKQLRDDLSADHADRIRREARAAARIDDPRVVTVHDLEHDADGTPFLVLEAHDGETLADELRRGPLPPERLDRLTDDLLGALGAAHACGVLHRDVKPSNLLLAGDGYRLTDFGIASLDDETATHGDLMGTLVYLAPERFDGAPASTRSDVFAAAAVLYEAGAGRQPFRGDSTADSMARLRSGRFDPLPLQAPPALVAAIGRALDPDPERRPADAVELTRMVAGHGPEPGRGPVDTEPIPAVPAGPTPRSVVVPAPAQAEGSDGHTEPMPVGLAAPTDGTAAAGPGGWRAWTADPRVRRLAEAARRPQVVFTAVAIAILVAVLVAAAVGGGSASADPTSPSPGPAADEGPAERLEQHLDRIEELGR